MIDIYLSGTFLFVSLLFYAIFGGADFGMGMVELLLKTDRNSAGIQKLSKHAIGAVWEANHVWIIVALVVSFVGFPLFFYHVFISLHVPLFILLLGIVVRGTAFSFRHYDTEQGMSHFFHTLFFKISSFITPFFLGMTLASLLFVFPDSSAGYMDAYIRNWVHLLPLVSGFLFVSLSTLCACAFLLFDSKIGAYYKLVFRLYQRVWWVSILLSGLGLLLAELTLGFLSEAFQTPLLLAVIVGTFLSFLVNFFAIHRRLQVLGFISTGGIVTGILLGFVVFQFPAMITLSSGPLSLMDAAAPFLSLRILNVSLVLGLVIVLPFLGYLFWVFKRDER